MTDTVVSGKPSSGSSEVRNPTCRPDRYSMTTIFKGRTQTTPSRFLLESHEYIADSESARFVVLPPMDSCGPFSTSWATILTACRPTKKTKISLRFRYHIYHRYAYCSTTNAIQTSLSSSLFLRELQDIIGPGHNRQSLVTSILSL